MPCISRKKLPNYGSIKSIFSNKKTTNSWCRMDIWHAEILKIAKSFGPCQPAQTAQADMGRYFSQISLTTDFKPILKTLLYSWKMLLFGEMLTFRTFCAVWSWSTRSAKVHKVTLSSLSVKISVWLGPAGWQRGPRNALLLVDVVRPRCCSETRVRPTWSNVLGFHNNHKRACNSKLKN